MRLAQIFPLCVALTLGGCGLFGGGGGSGPLVADVMSPIVDVPVPAGFSMSASSSSKEVAAGGLRVVDHYYTGQDEFLAVANFYKERLPQKGWTWVEQIQPTGKEVIEHFTKKGEDCTVTVTKRLFDTMIRIQIKPLGR
jgi:hypothetical protein